MTTAIAERRSPQNAQNPQTHDSSKHSLRILRVLRLNVRSEKGQALIETALTLPIVLLLSVSIFEFGRAFETWQVLTNAAREGARISVLPDATVGTVQNRVLQYMAAGDLRDRAAKQIAVNRTDSINMGAGPVSASRVTVSYPFSFMVLNPVIRLLVGGSKVGAPITITSSALMRNESPN
jgi:Flp pilus assembly protein TadG